MGELGRSLVISHKDFTKFCFHKWTVCAILTSRLLADPSEDKAKV